MGQISQTSETITTPAAVTAATSLLANLTLADKVIAGGVAAGLISSVLPALSVTVNFLGVTQSSTALVLGVWQGDLGVLSLITAGVTSFLLIKKGPAASKNLLYANLGACALSLLLALWLFASAAMAGHGAPDGMEEMMKVSVSFGAYLFVLSGLTLAGGAFLKAKDAHLIPGVGTPVAA